MVLKQLQHPALDMSTAVEDRARAAEQRWSGIISTGQSLSTGAQAPLSAPTPVAPFAYQLFDSSSSNPYDITAPTSPTLSLAPLTEPIRPNIKDKDASYPGNIEGKTPHHSMALQIALLCKRAGLTPPTTVHSAVGKSGAPMWEIRKDGTRNAYAASIFEATALHRLAAAHPASLEYDAIVLTHGESDALLGHTTYADELIKLHAAYAADLRRLTAQPHAPTLLLTQQHAFPCTPAYPVSQLVQDQWFAQRTSANAIVCAGPKYHYAYAPGGLHLAAPGYNRLGEKYAAVYFAVCLQRRLWQPLAPMRLELTAPTIVTATFHVPVGPLRWDDALPAPHQAGPHACWAAGRGFEVRDAAGQEVGIAGVELAGADAVRITLATVAYAKPLMLAYAMTQEADEDGSAAGGTGRGRMGHLCDGDDMPSASEEVKTVQLRRGSREVICPDGWEERATWDFVDAVGGEHAEGRGENCIVEFDDDNPSRVFLHKEWSGADGWHEVRVGHNLRNYCVSFSMPVTWALGTGI